MATNSGKVKWFDNKKGYGFIEQPGGEDLFVHYSDIEGDGFKTLEEGAPVAFDVSRGAKGLRAQHVRLVTDSATPSQTTDPGSHP